MSSAPARPSECPTAEYGSPKSLFGLERVKTGDDAKSARNKERHGEKLLLTDTERMSIRHR